MRQWNFSTAKPVTKGTPADIVCLCDVDADQIPYGGFVLEDSRVVLRLADCAPAGTGMTVTIHIQGFEPVPAFRMNVPPLGQTEAPGEIDGISINPLPLESSSGPFPRPPVVPRGPLGPLDPPADGCQIHHMLPPNILPVIAAAPGSVLHRRFVRGNFFGVSVPGLPYISGGSRERPDLLLTWFLHKYAPAEQDLAVLTYAQRGYWDWLTMVADARADGVGVDAFVAECQKIQRAGLRNVVSFGSKGIDPSNDVKSGWPTRALEYLKALVAAKAIDKAIVGFELDLWNDPRYLQGIIDLFADACQLAGIYLYVHFSPRVTSWQIPGTDRVDWWRQQKGKLRGIFYQADTSWSVALLQARLDELLVIFTGLGPADEIGLFDQVAAELCAFKQFPKYDVTEDRGDAIGFQALCTPDNEFGTGPCPIMGLANGGRFPSGGVI